ncbi:MAG: accessory gene regulator ArgB-like protein [Peptostreptococcaceae bacterium]
MSFVEHISLNTSKKLGERLKKNEEEIAVINYGLFFILHTLIAIIATFITGMLFNVLLEIMVISLSAAMLKRYSGGVHSSTPNRCVLSGLILSLILSFISRYISNRCDYKYLVFFICIGLAFSIFMIYKKCPVPSKNKPLKKESTRIKLRKKASRLMFLYAIAIAGLSMYYEVTDILLIKTVIISITMGVLLQIVVMTKLGEYLIVAFEGLFNLFHIK